MTTEITEILNGFKQFSENPYSDSIKFLKEYIDVEPTSEAYFELGKALFLNNDYDESIKYLKKSDDFRSDAYLGLDYYKKEDFKNAIEHFEEFLKENTNETILAYLMISYEKNCDWKNAIEYGEKLLEINQDNVSIKLHLIDYHFNQKEYEKSLDYINELDDRKLKYKKGLVLFNLKRYEEAIDEIKSMKSIEAYRLISKAYEKLDKPSKAIRYLLKSYEKDPDIEILFEVSEISFKNQNHPHSIRILEEILMENPDNEKALEKIAKNYLELQKFEFAIEYCEKLLKVNKTNTNAYLYLSDAHYIIGTLEEALEFTEKGLSIDPKSVDLLIQKAWIYYVTDFEEFKKTFEKVLKLEPNNTKNYVTLIKNCTWENEIDNARKYYDKLIFYNPAFCKSFDELTKNIIESLKKNEYCACCYCGL